MKVFAAPRFSVKSPNVGGNGKNDIHQKIQQQTKSKDDKMFIVSLTYKKDISEVEKFIESHIQFLDKYYADKKFIFSGRKNPRTGGVILVRNVNKQTLMYIIQQDPFYQNEIADYEITEVIPTKYDKDFACFAK